MNDIVKQLLTSKSERMLADLQDVRDRLRHRGNRGIGAEEVFRTFLTEYLPRSLAIGHGEVIDRDGRRSRQTDIVIVNELHPLTFTANSLGLFFIEGVEAVGEVKSRLTTRDLIETFSAAREFKQLRSRRLDPIIDYCAFTGSALPQNRFLRQPPYFLFAFESEITLDLILERARNEAAGDTTSTIDAICVLNRGCAFYLADGRDVFSLVNPDSKESCRGWEMYERGGPLVDFLTWLSIVMPRDGLREPILLRYLCET